MPSGTIRLNVEGGIARLVIARPEKRNALTAEMMDLLLDTCRRIECRDDVHAAILTGEGESFSAGGDINAWSSQSPDEFGRRWVRNGHQALDALARLRQPLVAVLNGHALGGGLEVAACADFRIAEEHVNIGQPECGIGILPGWSGTQRAVRRFGAQVVRRMALFGEVYSAEEALQLGLVDRVARRGHGVKEAVGLARRVARRGFVATELTKMLINAAEGEERERVLESLAGRHAAASPELEAGLAAFRAKRKPGRG